MADNNMKGEEGKQEEIKRVTKTLREHAWDMGWGGRARGKNQEEKGENDEQKKEKG